jgi:4-hydroxy-2-oxoheptanedioate aldolase
MTVDALREAWQRGEPTFGAWATIGNEHSLEILSRACFDWIGLDLQHGLIDAAQVPSLVRTLNITGTPSLVRVAYNGPDQIMRVLDAGADGVIVPAVSSPDEARTAAFACRYPPAGTRSWGPARPSLIVERYHAAAGNERVVCAVMAETVAAIDVIDEITAVPGVDAVFVGPVDLGFSYGRDGTKRDDGFLAEKIEIVRASCERARVVPGIFAGSARAGLKWADKGFKLVAMASDAALLRGAATEMAAAVADRTPALGASESGYGDPLDE